MKLVIAFIESSATHNLKFDDISNNSRSICVSLMEAGFQDIRGSYVDNFSGDSKHTELFMDVEIPVTHTPKYRIEFLIEEDQLQTVVDVFKKEALGHNKNDKCQMIVLETEKIINFIGGDITARL